MFTKFFFLLLCFNIAFASSLKKAYIVYLGGKRGIEADELTRSHHDLLATAVGSYEAASEAMIYSYKHAFSGFSAHLTEEQALVLSNRPEVLSIRPSKMLQPFTTRSWDFLGLVNSNTSLQASTFRRPSAPVDVIVGLLDTGIWPESQSFKDTGLGPVPARWKGACVNPKGTKPSDIIHCNRKLIGARYYGAGLPPNTTEKYPNARDQQGHGTHTSSTAAGSLVPHASKRGLAEGTARGGAPDARIAMYKVCWDFDCAEVDIMAAFDDAINDGVDILSISLGGQPELYSLDVIAIGAYHAVEKGIVVSCAAGNSGPFIKSVTNSAPWILTVGASTIDRKVDEAADGKRGVLRGTTIPYKPAPIVAEFSSRGPNSISLDIIKPDVTAPGVEILAAWPSNIPDYDSGKEVYVNYTFLSGTSMACPHAAGTVAYLKFIHPTWSPAALKSAMMTTGITLDNTNKTIVDPSNDKPANVFDIGSGEIQPVKAADPGLVYDTEPLDYILYLCSSGYTSKQVQNITGDPTSKCLKNSTFASLNYPSIGFASLSGKKTVQRTVTNVGPASSVYTVHVESAKGLNVAVEPTTLKFTSTGQKLSYSVTLSSDLLESNQDGWVFSSLTWSDGTHVVRSPIAVSFT